MIAAIEFKRRMTDTGIFCIIVGKFSYWEKSNPVILLIIDEGMEISFYSTILPLCLAISLRMEGY